MDVWLTRIYERRGAAYLLRAILVTAALGSVTLVPGVIIMPSLYEGIPLGRTLGLIGVAIGACYVISAIAFLTQRRRVRASVLDYVEISIGSVAAFSFLIAAVYLAGEVIMRPIRASFARVKKVEAGGRGLTARLLVASLGLAAFAAAGAGLSQVRHADTGPGGMLEVFAAAFAATAVVALVMTPLVSGTVLGPIRSLMSGTRSVNGGNLDALVPVTTADEFGELAASFNDMVEGLREREALRGDKARLVDELTASRARIVAAADEARRRVERDLHDGAQQSLVVLNLKLGMLERRLDDRQEAAAVAELRSGLEHALAELRDLAHGIYPQALSSDGLAAALAQLAQDAPIVVHIEPEERRRYPPEIEAAVYFCCLEALQNVAKYAGKGASARIALAVEGGQLRFEVADDGTGFDPVGANGGAGLQNMADRIGALGGELRIDSAPGSGTRVAGSVPVGV